MTALIPETQAPTSIDRRGFLQTSLLGGAALTVTGAAATLSGCGGKAVQTAEGYRYLRAADVELFTAIGPVVLAPVANAADFAAVLGRVLQRIDTLAFNLDAPARKTVYQLFDLLNMRVTRWITTGIAAPWAEATEGDIEAFLVRWRDSSIGLFNVGYRALTKFVAASYFSLADSRAVTAYPGPQAWALQATSFNTQAGK